MKKTLSWVCSVFLLLAGIVYMPSIASILLLIGGVLILPIKKWQTMLKNKLRIPGTLKAIIAAVLFVVSMLIVPSTETGTMDDQPSNDVTPPAVTETIEDTEPEGTKPAEEENPAVSPSKEPSVESNDAPEPTPTQTPTPTPAPSSSPVNNETPPTESIPANSTFSIHFIDVGQADAALVECDGHYALIDGGNKEDSSVIYSVLKKAGVSHLDIVVATHAHSDHLGGIPGAFNYASADLTLCPVKSYDSDAFADFVKYANQKGGGITVPRKGDTYSLGSAKITILGVNGGEDANNTSIVLKIQYGETSFLFTGDAEREAEQATLNSGADLSATVLKVGHHGSDTSTSYTFLREIMPQYAVISVGEGNSYGHPTDTVLSRLRDADVTVYRTDLQGDIFCTSDGKTVSFSVERNPNADTLEPGVIPTPEPTPTPSQESTDTPNDNNNGSYIGNVNSKVFHSPSCKTLPKEQNRVYFSSREEAVGANYRPCGNCNP